MRSWACRGAALTVLTLAAPAAGQDAPKPLLPDVFGSPPPVAPSPSPSPAAEPEEMPAPPPVAAPAKPLPIGPNALATAPTRVRRIDVVGPLTRQMGGYGANAFVGANGTFLVSLIKRIDVPIGSRWAHIVVRRALLSRVPTPAGVRPADWVAARALLLVKMGEADGAKLLVESLPLDRYTTALYSVASQVHLAAADVPALCPLAPTAKAFSSDLFWDLAGAICSGIAGDDITAAATFDRLRRGGQVDNIDLVLAERVTSVASGEGSGANVEWGGVDRLDAYRFGLATAAGVEIPEALTKDMPASLTGWTMRAPGIGIERRAEVAVDAAARGIASAGELAAIASAQVAALRGDELRASLVGEMRSAYSGRTSEERIAAMQTIWKDGDTALTRYGRLIQTAPAAARIPPAPGEIAAAPQLIRSMLSAGYAQAALRWWPILRSAPAEGRFSAWPLLALVDPGHEVPVSRALVRGWYKWARGDRGASADRKAGLLVAALAGLGRTGGGWPALARDFGVRDLDNSYTRALTAAAGRQAKGEVAVLVGAGLQADWAHVSPGQLQAVLAAMMKVGLDEEARMLAVEALTRG